MTDPWGPPAPHPDPPEPLPPQLAKLAAVTKPEIVTDWAEWENPGPAALPEVATLLAQGWRLLGSDPRHAVLPAVWPTDLRCWLPDRMPKVYSSFNGRIARIIPAAWSGHPELEAPDFPAELAVELGVPVPPQGRIWLLRSPWPRIGLKVALQLFARRAAEQDGYEAAAIIAAASEMLRWDETEVLAWWTGEEADAALAWQEQGRVGNDVAELVCAGIGPDGYTRMPGLTPEQAAGWRWAVAGRTAREAVDRVVFFRSVGLGVTPPTNLYQLAHLAEEDVRAWLAAGFDVPSMVQLAGLSLDQAVSWRHHGYPPAQARELLGADSELTAAEADAFAAAGIVGRHRIDWIRHGFAAADAAVYDELDIQPNEARVWRSLGVGPADSQPGQYLPPGYQRRGWTTWGDMRMRDAEHQVPDPPGTRGDVAARSRDAQQRARRRPPRPGG